MFRIVSQGNKHHLLLKGNELVFCYESIYNAKQALEVLEVTKPDMSIEEAREIADREYNKGL